MKANFLFVVSVVPLGPCMLISAAVAEYQILSPSSFQVLSVTYHIPDDDVTVNFYGFKVHPKEWVDRINCFRGSGRAGEGEGNGNNNKKSEKKKSMSAKSALLP